MNIKNPDELNLMLLHKDSPGRKKVEEFSKNIYRRFYGADLITFPKEFLAITHPSKGITSCLGINYGKDSTLFLEQYLDAPIEEEVTSMTGREVKREDIVEIGTLAVRSKISCRMIIAALVGHLVKKEKKYLVFTGVKTLRNTLTRLGIPFTTLTTARADRVKDNSKWGSYYEAAPEVVLIDINAGTNALKGLIYNNADVVVGFDPPRADGENENIVTSIKTETRLWRRIMKQLFLKGLLLEDAPSKTVQDDAATYLIQTEEVVKQAIGF